MDDARKREFDAIVVWRFDRFARSPRTYSWHRRTFELRGVGIAAKSLIKMKELVDHQGREQERNSKTGGIDCEQEHSAQNCVAACGKDENSGENRSDTGCPAKRKGKARQETACEAAEGPALLPFLLRLPPKLRKCTSLLSKRVNDSPARKMSATESNSAEPKRLAGPKVSAPQTVPSDQRGDSEHSANHYPRSCWNSDRQGSQVKTEEQYDCSCQRSHQRAIT
jgi:hypothetical protein